MLHKFVIPHPSKPQPQRRRVAFQRATPLCGDVFRCQWHGMLVGGWLAPLLAKFTKCSRVQCAGLRTLLYSTEMPETARFVDTVTVSTRCAIVRRLCNLPFAPRKVEGAKVQRKLTSWCCTVSTVLPAVGGVA